MHAEEENIAAWYAIRIRSRHEKLVNQQLASRDIDVFLPLVMRRRRWADRWKNVSFPLFPGYCFARFPYERRVAAVSSGGFMPNLGINGHSTPRPDRDNEEILQLVTCPTPLAPP